MVPTGSSALRLEEETRELVRVVAMGSVDDGKSTLLGRLLYETGALYDDQLAAVKRASRLGGEIDFSLFTDGLRAEREQGITIDVAYRYFSTPRRKFILGDTPGHAQYTRNMATGASTADVGIVLIDARLGVLPQSRRHLAIAALLGIPRLAVCINKLDLVGFDRGAYERISAEVRAFAARLGFEDLRLFPVCARDGDNVAERSARTPWHKDGTLLDFLETVPVAREAASGRLRFPVQAVIRADPDYRGYAGRIASGTVRVGDEVVVLPSGARTRVQSIDTFEGQLLAASAPLSITLRLADAVDASRGDLIAPAGAAPAPRTELEANAVWLSERPLDPGRAYLLKHTTRLVPARVEAVRWRLDPETLEEQPAVRLELNELGRIAVRCMRPVASDAYADNRATGAFILIDALTNDTVAAGTVVEGASGESAREALGDAHPVSADERRARLGHRAAVVLAGDARAAAALERSLFDRGCAVTVVRSAEAALACAAAGLVAIVVISGDELARARLHAELRASGAPLVEPPSDLDTVLARLEELGALPAGESR